MKKVCKIIALYFSLDPNQGPPRYFIFLIVPKKATIFEI
jgi:hypothetical protein